MWNNDKIIIDQININPIQSMFIFTQTASMQILILFWNLKGKSMCSFLHEPNFIQVSICWDWMQNKMVMVFHYAFLTFKEWSKESALHSKIDFAQISVTQCYR